MNICLNQNLPECRGVCKPAEKGYGIGYDKTMQFPFLLKRDGRVIGSFPTRGARDRALVTLTTGDNW